MQNLKMNGKFKWKSLWTRNGTFSTHTLLTQNFNTIVFNFTSTWYLMQTPAIFFISILKTWDLINTHTTVTLSTVIFPPTCISL